MDYLVSTYNMIYGDILQGIIRAINVNGPGEYSEINVIGASILTAPTYMNPPYEGSATTSTSI